MHVMPAQLQNMCTFLSTELCFAVVQLFEQIQKNVRQAQNDSSNIEKRKQNEKRKR